LLNKRRRKRNKMKCEKLLMALMAVLVGVGIAYNLGFRGL